jgi:hypothetical protein
VNLATSPEVAMYRKSLSLEAICEGKPRDEREIGREADFETLALSKIACTVLAVDTGAFVMIQTNFVLDLVQV